MDYPRSPLKAVLPAPRALNDELQLQAHHPFSDDFRERRQSLYLRQQLMSILPPFVFRPDQLLPISNASPAPGLGDATPLRRRSGGSQHNNTRADEFTRLNGNRLSIVDKQNTQGEKSKKEGEESSCGSSFSYTDIRKERQKNRIEELTKILKPMLPENGSGVVLLCWCRKSGCSIMPVHVSNTDDEVSMWSELHNAWYARRGYWRKHIPGFSVSQVEIVEVSILGFQRPLNRRKGVEYIGQYEASDNIVIKERLQDVIDTNISTSECYHDRETGDIKCSFGCVCWDCFPDPEKAKHCPVKALRDAIRKISLLDARALLRHVFSNPILAASNDFLKREGLALSHRKKYSLTTNIRGILSHFNSWHCWHCPALTELKFRGLVINEGWTPDFHRKALVILVFSGVILASKVLFGWDTAWTVGGCFVALVTLFLGKL
ncbi:hypothetical protein F1880_001980 [Penicillium rolfsii]|nr:hypothetical protein F1880_001980 [Penicillium rolfsii]